MNISRKFVVNLHFRISHYSFENNADLLVFPVSGNFEFITVEPRFITWLGSLYQIETAECIFSETLQFPL